MGRGKEERDGEGRRGGKDTRDGIGKTRRKPMEEGGGARARRRWRVFERTQFA